MWKYPLGPMNGRIVATWYSGPDEWRDAHIHLRRRDDATWGVQHTGYPGAETYATEEDARAVVAALIAADPRDGWHEVTASSDGGGPDR